MNFIMGPSAEYFTVHSMFMYKGRLFIDLSTLPGRDLSDGIRPAAGAGCVTNGRREAIFSQFPGCRGLVLNTYRIRFGGLSIPAIGSGDKTD